MDNASRRPQLPALSYLDVDKAKKEEDTYQSRNSGGPPYSNATSAAVSPSYHHPPGPPPPYSHQNATTWTGGVQPAVHTPPDSRRTSGEEHENAKQTTRQSLPSISEALGVDSQTSFSTPTSAPAPPSQSTHLQKPQSTGSSSPHPTERRSYAMEAPPSQQQYSYFRQDSAGPQTFTSSEGKPGYGPQESRHLQSSHAPPRAPPAGTYSTSSPQIEPPKSQSSGSMGPPSFPYGYTPYPPRYAQTNTPSGHSSGPIYQPSAQHPAPPTPASGWKPDGTPSRYADERSSAPAYGESVKRQLDLYDLEGALNEIAQTSSIMLDFSRRYGDRMHQNARAGPSLSTLPSTVEVEDMISKSRVQLESLNKIREVIRAQQAAYEQQLADQRHKAFPEPPPPMEHHLDSDDGKGGFAGSDTKKRRGRAAPPGRCHSCNRAETPEWRRGPDGARTLCNACGLHYAKLTRKQTQTSKNTSVGSSNIRPKEA